MYSQWCVKTFFSRIFLRPVEDKVEELYQAGAIEQVVKLLVSEHEMIATHACWFVTNMCSDSTWRQLQCKQFAIVGY
jgi:hypothetical protein